MRLIQTRKSWRKRGSSAWVRAAAAIRRMVLLCWLGLRKSISQRGVLGRRQRITTISMEGYVGPPEQTEDGQTLLAGPEPADAFITLDPATFSDLEEELTEVGFGPEAAARIVSTVPQ